MADTAQHKAKMMLVVMMMRRIMVMVVMVSDSVLKSRISQDDN